MRASIYLGEWGSQLLAGVVAIRKRCRPRARIVGHVLGLGDDLMAVDSGRDHRLDDGGDRQGEDHPGGTHQRPPDDDRADRDGRVDRHGLRRDFGGDDEVLELLVRDQPHQDPHRLPEVVGQGDEHGEGRTHVGADYGEELAEDPDPDPHRQGVVDADHQQEADRERAGHERQDHPRIDVPAGLVDGDLPDPQRFPLAVGGEERQDGAPQLGAFRHHVEGEQGDGEGLEDHAHHRRPDAEDPTGDSRAHLLEEVPQPREFALGFGVEEADVQPPVQLVLDGGDVLRDRGDQIRRLGHDSRDHRCQQTQDEQGRHQEHRPGGKPSPPASSVEELDGRLQGHGDEQRHEDHVEEAAQLEQQPQGGGDTHEGDRHRQRRPPKRTGVHLATGSVGHPLSVERGPAVPLSSRRPGGIRSVTRTDRRMMDQPIVWRPDEERASRTHTARFMARHGIATYDELYARSIDDPEWFWDAVVDYLGIPFTQPYRQVMDLSRGAPWARWFVGGQVNLSAACVDRWVESQGDLPAVIGEREDGESVAWTFSELREVVSRLAGGLARLGVQPGDAVGVFLPMSPEAIAAFLATARVGAEFIPIFSGYAAEAVANRLLDPRPRVLICADGFFRRGRLVEMKEVADAAVDIAGGGIDHVVVVHYAGRDDTPWTEGRDVAWADVLRSEPADALPVDSEHPVMIAYTSGTTGRPKGSVHVHGGFTVKIAQEGAFLTDVHPGDRLMWATDMGWIMGPWMTVAALANGATAVTYDGAPDHPGPDRLWEVAEKHRLTHLGLSPTLIRALQPHGADQARRHDLSSLRAFGSTGEPLNPDPWWWLFREVGGEQVPIVNISGGTEIAAVILGVN